MSHAVIIVAIESSKDRSVPSTDEVEKAIRYEMEPFDENGDWFKDGSRWDWYQIGGRWSGFFGQGRDVIKLKSFDPDKFSKERIKELTEYYYKAKNETHPFTGINKDESLEDYLGRHNEPFPVTRAFLRLRHWHENGRMGWFGCDTATECEREGKETRKCHKKMGDAFLTTWNEDRDTWDKKFFDRFIKPLDPETVLIAVDYHV